MNASLSEADLPGFWRDSDRASLRGQKWTMRYSFARLAGSVIAALGGVISVSAGRLDIAALVILVGFAIALIAELALWIHHPEQAWYDGRALAESAKTLAWRYAVGADPFPDGMPEDEARELLRTRLGEVSSGSLHADRHDRGAPVDNPGYGCASKPAIRRSPCGIRWKPHSSSTRLVCR